MQFVNISPRHLKRRASDRHHDCGFGLVVSASVSSVRGCGFEPPTRAVQKKPPKQRQSICLQNRFLPLLTSCLSAHSILHLFSPPPFQVSPTPPDGSPTSFVPLIIVLLTREASGGCGAAPGGLQRCGARCEWNQSDAGMRVSPQ